MFNIFEGVISGLLFAWILTFFHVNKMLIEVLQPFTTITLTNSTYYVFFILIGVVVGILRAARDV